jgi:cobalt/nickel transport system permease protein
MHHDFIDKHSRLHSSLHRAPAGLKLCAALALVLSVVVAPASWVGLFVGVALLLGAGTVLSGIPVRFILGRLIMLEPFVAGVALLAVFQPNGGLVAVQIIVRSTLSLATMILLTNTTPFSSLLALLRKIGVPALFVTVLALMYRYLFVLIDEAERMQRARLSRTFTGSTKRRWWTLAGLIGQLFVRSTARAERIYSAMCARGWQ